MSRQSLLSLLASWVLIVGVNDLAAAQSPELDRPTQIVSREVNVRIVDRETRYFSFEAGPGDVTLMFAARMDGGAYTGGSIDCQLYDQNHRPMNLGLGCGFGVNSESQIVRSFSMPRRQTVILGVQVLSMVQPTAPRYRFRLNGAVNLDPNAPPQMFPQDSRESSAGQSQRDSKPYVYLDGGAMPAVHLNGSGGAGTLLIYGGQGRQPGIFFFKEGNQLTVPGTNLPFRPDAGGFCSDVSASADPTNGNVLRLQTRNNVELFASASPNPQWVAAALKSIAGVCGTGSSAQGTAEIQARPGTPTSAVRRATVDSGLLTGGHIIEQPLSPDARRDVFGEGSQHTTTAWGLCVDELWKNWTMMCDTHVHVVAYSDGSQPIVTNTAEELKRAAELCVNECLVSVWYSSGRREGFLPIGDIERYYASIYRPGTAIKIAYQSKKSGHVFTTSEWDPSDKEFLFTQAFGPDRQRPRPGAIAYSNTVGYGGMTLIKVGEPFSR